MRSVASACVWVRGAGSGAISSRELGDALQGVAEEADSGIQQMMTSLILTHDAAHRDEVASTRHALETSHWVVDGASVAEVRKQVHQILARSGAQVMDLVKLFDADADNALQIDQMEFLRALRTHFHYRGPLDVIDQLFRSLDVDEDGTIGFNELYTRPPRLTHTVAARTRFPLNAFSHSFTGIGPGTILWRVLRVL